MLRLIERENGCTKTGKAGVSELIPALLQFSGQACSENKTHISCYISRNISTVIPPNVDVASLIFPLSYPNPPPTSQQQQTTARATTHPPTQRRTAPQMLLIKSTKRPSSTGWALRMIVVSRLKGNLRLQPSTTMTTPRRDRRRRQPPLCTQRQIANAESWNARNG